MSELGTEMNRTESYNPVTQEWCQLSAMLTSRAYIALAALDGCLYAVGGWNEDGGALSTVEKYSIEEVRSCAHMVSLSVRDVVSLSVRGVVSLSVRGVVSLSVRGVVSLSVRDVVSLSVRDVVSLSVRDVVSLSVRDVVSLSVRDEDGLILTLHFCSRLYAGSHFCQARIVLVDA